MKNKQLIIIGSVDGMPVAVDPETEQILVLTQEPMGNIFSDIGDVFKDHVSNLDFKVPDTGSFFSSGTWDTISGVFDSDTAVGQFVVPGIQTYVQNLASGGNYSPSAPAGGYYPSGYPSGSGGFVPSAPQVVTVPSGNVAAPQAEGIGNMLSNPLVLGVGAVLLFGTIAVIALNK